MTKLKVSLAPLDALALIATCKEEAFDFRALGESKHHLELELWVDCNPTPTRVVLHSGGTWTLSTEVTL